VRFAVWVNASIAIERIPDSSIFWQDYPKFLSHQPRKLLCRCLGEDLLNLDGLIRDTEDAIFKSIRRVNDFADAVKKFSPESDQSWDDDDSDSRDTLPDREFLEERSIKSSK
jgi:hypothetical protein